MRTISYDTYYDKVYGGWIGKCIGGNIGACVENNKYLMDLQEEEVFPEEIPPNDDLDLQLLWLQVLEHTGVHLTGKDLAEAWLQYCWYPFNEYGYFLHNYQRYIHPPVSGSFNNHYFAESMGSPIRSEIWGMISVGNAELAKAYAYEDATLDHEKESVWGEQMLAAMEAEAFFEDNMDRLIEAGLTHIPSDSRLYRCIRYIQRLHNEQVEWTTARQRMLEQFGHPDASKAVQNIGITVLALLYGEGDFAQTQMISLNCGYDTDCTCATAGAIFGIMHGASQLPELWKSQAKDTFTVGIDVVRPSSLISDLATDTCRVGVALTRSLNSAVSIQDVPADLGVERIPVARKHKEITIDVDYLGVPAVGFGETKQVALTVTNNTDGTTRGKLLLSVPEGFEISPQEVQLTIGAGDSFVQAVYIHVPETEKVIPAGITVNAVYESGGREAGRAQFGLAGSQSYYVMGPFWDLYDTKEHDSCPFYDPVHNRKSRPRGPASFNNYVNLEKAYINEASFEQLPAGGARFNSPEHKVNLEDWFGMEGPACFYLIQDIDSLEELDVRIMIGNNNGFKLWVNDELAAQSSEACFWMPYNHDIPVRLRQGRNRIVSKLVRVGEKLDYSFGIAESVPHSPRHFSWVNGLSSIVITP
ncbi:ADP-ribosylglycohydrolase family protein [Paenibacillus radicis (ex Xue et al. 2023)]|uniref:ADP-ribosylglycohydrolase family protein n=1 Tax=Paenibacillus radicis (ex Xue et al. 2023) TaxID=2972489 RepID=A0ABT1YV90_9BACL|nr:ADP-ribosylglycohydrolase family protein [Paenibacillus radicis (ex Xue et al. 2023)]MCR8636847.1 ADP-ribosylglycohydrolase family protein [Paenibacillus radicis (ex Xue et al. 2023)]